MGDKGERGIKNIKKMDIPENQFFLLFALHCVEKLKFATVLCLKVVLPIPRITL